MELYNQKVAPIMDKVCEICKLDGLNNIEALQNITKKIPVAVKPSHLVLSLSTILVLLSLLNVGSSLICNIVGFIYPAYMSFKALESPDNKDDKQWLTYWVVYSLFTVLDTFIGFTLSFIPFYYFLKLAFFVYLFHPQTLGAVAVYDKVVQPILRKYESKIDENIQKISK